MSELSPELRAFLRDCISSYEELEALLLLARSSDRSWSAAELAGELKVPEDGVAMATERLAAIDGLLGLEQQAAVLRFRYTPNRDSLRQVVAELEEAYRDQRLRIVQLMSANALERVRGAAARRLAEGFRIDRWKR